ncbi:hypothetical protein AC622_10865 [Bacillus sp. FJAT-27916]|nr:hypothetical protein AC622_10865 [Bacillus sp. FJAT-27916]
MPTTIIELGILIFIFIGLNVLALFLTSFKKMLRIISWIILIAGITFYSIRPFLVDLQTKSAIEKLDTHLERVFPEDHWEVTDSDDYRLTNEKKLFVIFENEPNVTYLYNINKQTVTQVDRWTKSEKSL